MLTSYFEILFPGRAPVAETHANVVLDLLLSSPACRAELLEALTEEVTLGGETIYLNVSRSDGSSWFGRSPHSISGITRPLLVARTPEGGTDG